MSFIDPKKGKYLVLTPYSGESWGHSQFNTFEEATKGYLEALGYCQDSFIVKLIEIEVKEKGE